MHICIGGSASGAAEMRRIAILSDEIRAAEMSQAPPAVSEWLLARADRNATRGHERILRTADAAKQSSAAQSRQRTAKQRSIASTKAAREGHLPIPGPKYWHVLPV